MAHAVTKARAMTHRTMKSVDGSAAQAAPLRTGTRPALPACPKGKCVGAMLSHRTLVVSDAWQAECQGRLCRLQVSANRHARTDASPALHPPDGVTLGGVLKNTEDDL